ncbi:MAG TPA: tetratricopeptide repeat protein [Verrucomicrobiota bacterium]|nr:tetratricopeptide repeat protein [Verrucomicrobiota bacterium]
MTVVTFLALRSPPPPLPVPAQFGQLDPQVRAYLTQLAQDAAAAPRNGSRRAQLGLAFAVNGLWAEAQICFADATKLGDRSPLPALYHAISRQELGDLAGSISELQDLTQKHPGFVPAWHRLGLALLAQGDAARAAAAFSEVTHRAPGEWRGWAGLGEARLKEGQANLAVGPLQHAVQLDPLARSARYLLGQALRASGRSSEAGRELAAGVGETIGPMPDEWSEAALGHMKGLPDQFEQTDSLLAEGQFQAALAILQEALRFHPTNRTVIQRMAAALTVAGRPQEALALIQPSLAREPDQVELLLTAAHAAATADQAAVAGRYVQRAKELAPQLAETHVALANWALAKGQDQEAAEALAQAVRLAPQNVALWLQYGDIQWHNLQQPEAALTSFTKAQELDPIHPAALERLAGVLLALGRVSQARPWVEELRHLMPGYPGLASLERALAAASSSR